MHNKEEFKELTMYEEIAYSITCLEKLCINWNIKSKKMAACIEILWGFDKDFDCWESNIYSLKNNSNRIKDELSSISTEQIDVIFNILNEIYSICLGNLYTKYRYTGVLGNILNIEEYLEKNEIEYPDLSFFINREKRYKNNLHILRCEKYCLLNNISFRDK